VGVEALGRAAGDGPVVCLLGAVGADDVVDLVRARSGPGTDLAVLTDIASWADAAPVRNRRASAASRAELVRQQNEAAALLRSAGWSVALAGADRSVEQVWAELSGLTWAVAGGAVGMPA
jgi:hypothetical protein